MSICIGLLPGLVQFLQERIFQSATLVSLRLGGRRGRGEGLTQCANFHLTPASSVSDIGSTKSL